MQRVFFLVASVLLGLVVAGPVFGQAGDGQSTIHVVQRDETLYSIALGYGTSVEAITQTNGLLDATSIQAGQRLLIPSTLVNAAIPTADRHIVQPGETLAHIALRYGSTPGILAALNQVVNPAQIFVGQILDVSEVTPGQLPLTTGYTHTVQPQETLYQLALQYHATVADILRANNLVSSTVVFPGQQLLIPRRDTRSGGAEDVPTLQILPEPLVTVNILPLPAEVGRTSRVRVGSSVPLTVSGMFLDRPLQFAAGAEGLTHEALVGVYAFTVPGMYPLTISWQDTAGTQQSFTTTIRVASGNYRSETIAVPEEQYRLLDPALNTEEYDLIAQLVSEFTPERHFAGPLGLPAAAPVTSPFGTRRSYNDGAYDRFHTGTDFGAPPDSPIYAPAAGTVKFSSNLAIHGLFTVIDHGWGVFTAYAHQEQSHVQPGQFVNAGEVIGTVGNSGRSIGPHLHWMLWINGVEVDGLQWTRFSFP
ncbi:LysM peptidoglycan-binding domain-containing protein [Chloroflexota bacterium]